MVVIWVLWSVEYKTEDEATAAYYDGKLRLMLILIDSKCHMCGVDGELHGHEKPMRVYEQVCRLGQLNVLQILFMQASRETESEIVHEWQAQWTS